MLQRSPLAIPLPSQAVAHQVAPDAFVDARPQHAVFERVSHPVKGVILGFEQLVLAQEFVSGPLVLILVTSPTNSS